MARKIVITSGKGGVGKTTVTANLGLCLARKALRVALVDLDVGLNNLDVALKIDNKVVFDMLDVIENRCRLRQALIEDDNEPSLCCLPSMHMNTKQTLTDTAVKTLITKMDNMFDYILIDCPAGIDKGFVRAVNCADEAIVICTPHLSSVRDADKVIGLLAGYDLLQTSIVVNRVRGDLVCRGEMLSAYEVFQLLDKKPLGVLPEEDCVNCFTTAPEYACEPYMILADNLHFGTSKMFDCIKMYSGFWGKIRSSIKRKV